MKYIKPFKEIDRTSIASYGGKAASLGDMTQAGIPVPNGFAISPEAFKEFSGRKMSDELEAEILSAFDALGSDRVAIRSSAAMEDGAYASWAGQLDSYLNVARADIFSKIRKCWRSINSARAVIYANDQGLDDTALLVGVVVQSMVDSEKSGVMFTVDPVSKDKNIMIIESIYGLGELLVQGVITPDNYSLSKSPLSVKEFNVAIKEKQMIYKNDQNRIIKVTSSVSDKAVLREEDILRLAKIGLTIEKHYKSPQDIEWAYASGRFYVVQSRAITTL